MAAADEGEKRKEPEVATTAAEPAAAEPEAKRQKTSGPDTAALRKQVEYYLSDDNLRTDKFFHEKIAQDAEGWLDIQLVLSCNKMRTMKASRENVMEALKDSKLELKENATHVRRPGNAALPKLEPKKQQHQRKNQAHAHDGGVVGMMRNVPSEQSWVQVKEKLTAKLTGKAKLWHVSEVNDKSQCFFVCPPFEGDQTILGETTIELGGAVLKCEVCFGDVLQQALKGVPKHIREKREKESKKKAKSRNRPFVIANQKFAGPSALRGKVREILNSRSDGEALKPEGTDFKLIRELMNWHPKGEEKTRGTVGIKVAASTQGDNRCFYMVKEDGTEDDVSMKKCCDAVEANPPYVAEEKPKEAPKTEEKKDEKPAEADKPAQAEKPAEAEKTAEAEKPAAAEKPADMSVDSAAPASEKSTETPSEAKA